MARHQKLRIKHLDHQLSHFRRVVDMPPPRSGWLHEIRIALGMTLRQFAGRMGSAAPQNAGAVEQSEAQGKISLNALRQAAHAIDCELVYAVVPRRTLEELLLERVRQVAVQRVQSVAHTMTLENQSVTPAYLESEIQELVTEMMHRPPKDLWELAPSR